MKRKLTPKQRKFANEFIKTNNAYQSAINAGYSKNYASVGTKKLLENVRIQNYIQQKTGNVEKRESDEADEVLKNIYRISAGKEIERHYVKIDNLAKEVAGGDDSIEARMEYMTDETTITPASTKEQVAAAELWLKLSGRLKNDSKDVEDQKIRKLKADADIAEAKAKLLRGGKDNRQVKTDEYLEGLKAILKDE
ncbi:terminase small subunit [Lactiplantibacillus paraplantarum]|uniref:terminase small subunit n=1 Tax=Lactiplantibacillus paraplantarum TaxID=60520 RepID=UPI0023AA8DA2|nr:terminase small subunit [Lactiplantibacillus paraplantarum]WEE35067.1 terminase small subunit [Lactiplantibacillus paraplantarum]